MINGDVEAKGEAIKTEQGSEQEIKIYRIRWFILGLFVLYSASNSMAWLQFSIIADVVVKYYGVSTTWVDWTSIIYMALYIPFIFPGSYLLEKLGLRKSVIIGMVGTCVGSWIKVGAVHPDRFWLAFIGQTVIAFSQVFILSVPAKLAAVWFGPSQVSSACSIGVFGNQLGIAIGFLVPPLIVKNSSTIEENTKEFYILFVTMSVFTTILLVLILMFFKTSPRSPPSFAAAQQESSAEVHFITSLKNLVKNRNFMFLLGAYGINTGIFYAISTLLNQIVLHYYPNASVDAGWMGLVIVVAGMGGSVCCGILLDRFHKFKETTLMVYACSAIAMIAFTFTLSKGIYVVYIICALLGSHRVSDLEIGEAKIKLCFRFFMTGLLPVGFELAVELTYPESEGTSAGLLNLACNLFGIIFTTLYSALFYSIGDVWADIIMCVMLVIGTVVTACINSDLRRQAANSASALNNDPNF
ncbi:hypothetical protein NQ317_003781 [Molorchus minor]|uniref:Major facilitator superfamily (MFS) profile domain-containing protein n=1 Tax=Molorchus minor TaxID=1323400 RepID=A0ABQ9JV52_9CUCU|nr:hypothetical protein NQ317_003781 [Molorchus minor]